MVDNSLQNEIKKDITGRQESMLETKVIDNIKRLQTEGKMDDKEVKNLYKTNFKKLLLGVDVKNQKIIDMKIEQINKVTNKLIAIQLSKPKESAGFINKIKNVIYRPIGIDANITKNNTTQNIMKGVIDEIMSLPEMLQELVKHPLEFAKGLKALFNGETWKQLWKEMTNIGLNTPAKQYQTGRTGLMVVLTVFPGGVGKTLLNIGKKAGKLIKSTINKGVKETGKKIITVGRKKTTQNFAKTKEAFNSGKNAIKDTKHFAKKTNVNANKIFDDATEARKGILKHINDLRKLTNDPNSKIKIRSYQNQLKDLNKTIKNAKSEIQRTNTKLGIDNNKLNKRIKLQNNVKKLEEKIIEKNKVLSKLKNKDPNRATVQKDIDKLSKSKEAALKKANDIDINIPKDALTTKTLNKLKSIPGFSLEKLKTLKNSPNRFSIIKDLNSLRKSNAIIKSINASLSDPKILNRKSLKSLIYQKQLEKTAQNGLKQRLGNQLTGLGVIAGYLAHKEEILDDENVTLILQYLSENNDSLEYYLDSETNGLRSGDASMQDLDTTSLEHMSDFELQNTHITIVGKASKTGVLAQNIALAQQRANNAKDFLLKTYPKLDEKNISLQYKVQADDNNDDINKRQGAELRISTINITNIPEYDNLLRDYVGR